MTDASLDKLINDLGDLTRELIAMSPDTVEATAAQIEEAVGASVEAVCTVDARPGIGILAHLVCAQAAVRAIRDTFQDTEKPS